MLDGKISIIVIAHREGEIASRTIKSLRLAAKEIKKNNIEYEFLANIDNGDKATKDFFKKNATDFKIFYTEFGDVGSARNSIIRKAKGKYIALIDADDMISANWLMRGIERLKSSSALAVVHPEIEVRFNVEKILDVSVRAEYGDIWRETLALIEGNRWCSIVVGKREIFLRHPYPRNERGFGYEDYRFNCDLTADGVRHLVARDTVAFCLQKEESVSAKAAKNHEVLAYTKLFNLKNIQRENTIKGLPDLNIESGNTVMPKNVNQEIKKIIKIWPNFREATQDLSTVRVGKNGKDNDLIVGSAFCKMLEKLRLWFLPRTLIFVDEPDDIAERGIGWRGLIVLMHDGGGVIENDKAISFGWHFRQIPPSAREIALERLIIQSKAKKMIVMSEEVRSWFEKRADFVKENHIELQ